MHNAGARKQRRALADIIASMPDWLSSIVISAATFVMIQVVFAPRVQARSLRILEAHAFRTQFSTRVTTIIGASARFQSPLLPDDASSTLTQAIETERERSVSQMDDATAYLFDNMEFFAMTYAGLGGVRALAIEYLLTCRAVWISDRTPLRKAEL